MSDAGKDLNLVLLDLHSPAPAVTLLSSPKLVVDSRDVDRKTRRQSLDNSHECLAVRFTCGCEFELHSDERELPSAESGPERLSVVSRNRLLDNDQSNT